ncbi:hypothetical protein LVJ94_18450 [Pendulispora rubella]|uniref:Uncharacterized protein n=1 Tax=Pendulispora rubella TaxID=2741070 RepID=A0ABZ2LE43_9BACT
MSDEPSELPPRTPRQKLASRLVYGSFLGLATAFILSSTYQLVVGVFGLGSEPLPGSAPPASAVEAQACSDGIALLSAALERSFAHSVGPDGASARTEEAVVAAFRKNLEPEWTGEPAIERTCGSHPHGHEAFAALLRLKLAQEGLVRRQMVEIDPLRRSVNAYLPH